MSKLHQLPRFHSNLVYQKPNNANNKESLRNIYPHLYYEEEVKRDSNENSSFANHYSYKENVNQSKSTCKKTSLTSISSDNLKRLEENSSRKLQDYGSETRDFIICCLEKSNCTNNSFLIQQPHQLSCNSQTFVQFNKSNKHERKIILKSDLTDVKNTPQSQYLETGPTIQKEAVEQCVTPPKSATKSRLPVLIKDYGRKKSVSGNSLLKTCNKSSSSYTSVQPNILRAPKNTEKSNTRWFKENKLQFTKKMTSYAFSQYGIDGNKISEKSDNNFFGFTF